MASTSLRPPLEGERRSLETSGGRVESYVLGSGRTTLLLHSFNAAGSGTELAALAERLAGRRRVVLVDWLGFGTSARPDVAYGPELYERLLDELVAAVLPEGESTIDVIALSLPGQYVAVAAADDPDRFGRIVLISPTGFGRFRARRQRLGRLAYAYLRLTGIGRLLFAVLSQRRIIDSFLRQLFADDASVPDAYFDYCVATCRRPGAYRAPLRFVTGLLDDPAAEAAYRRLAVPTLLVFGDHPRFTDPEAAAAITVANPFVARETVIDSGDLPQIERPDETAALVAAFLDGTPDAPVTDV